MRNARLGCVGLLAVGAVLFAALLAPSADAATTHQFLFKVFNFPGPKGGEYFEAPCGITVRPDGGFYVADYYHHKIESFDSDGEYLSAQTGVDPSDGPCGLAADSTGDLFVEGFHADVIRQDSSGGATTVDAGPSTGIAYDPGSGDVYVDDRDHIAVYDESGQPVEVGGAPLEIGVGNLGDGYGVAVSSNAGTEGFVYVADAATDTIKVFDPATSLETPVAEIDGADDPQGGFATLVDAALAVDDGSGDVFVVYNAQGPFYVHPLAAVAEFDPAGEYQGTVEPGVSLWFGEASGIAVDNTGGTGQGRVYVTSGNSQVEHPFIPSHPPELGSPGKPEEGSVFAFGPAVVTPSTSTIDTVSASSPGGGPEDLAAAQGGAEPQGSVVPGGEATGTSTTSTASKAAALHRRHAKAHHRGHRRTRFRHRKARRN